MRRRQSFGKPVEVESLIHQFEIKMWKLEFKIKIR